MIEREAGREVGIPNEEFQRAGATIADRDAIFNDAEMVLKVKEPVLDEPDLLHEGQLLFAYLHLAPEKELTEQVLNKRITAIAYDSIELGDGSNPLLAHVFACSLHLLQHLVTVLQLRCLALSYAI